MRSAAGLNSFIDDAKYTKYVVTIVGKKWQVELVDGRKLPIDKNDFSFMLDGRKIAFDFAYITIHGTPGENGILQGYFRLLGIPFSCCDVWAAALTFNKFPCNQYLKSFGINVAKSVWLHRGDVIDTAKLVAEIGLPCFIKPCDGGSSFGVTKVKAEEQIMPAIEKAFAEGSEVMVEALMTGTEVTCGMYRTKTKEVVFPITEVVTHNEFLITMLKSTVKLKKLRRHAFLMLGLPKFRLLHAKSIRHSTPKALFAWIILLNRSVM